jgi:hypothetical protein
MAQSTPETRARRGCNFIILLFVVLAAVNFADGGTNGWAFRVFAGLLIASIIARIVIATDRSAPQE